MLDEYIRLHGRRLYGLCRTLCRNPFDADDLYQETWLRALRFLSRYDPSRPFEPWLVRICVNTYRNNLRRALHMPLPVARVPVAETDEDAPEDTAPLRRAIDALPERLRLTIVLYYFHDMDIALVARALKVPEGTVKSRLHRARAMLKEALEREKQQENAQ